MDIALTGDVMLGRLVDEEIVRNRSLPPMAIWGDILPLLLGAELRMANLECVISHRGQPWHPETKAFHFRAHPHAIDLLTAARVDVVTLANNHVLDYGTEALADCVALLDQAGIRHAGAGRSLSEAIEPAVVTLNAMRVAVLAMTDNEPEWAAEPARPGVNHVACGQRGLLEPYRTRIADAIRRARQDVDFVIMSAHIGPNWGAPSGAMRALAHDVLDLGADLYWCHSNHTPQGIEVYQGKVILHSTGDFVDDYAVDPEARNDLSYVFIVEVAGGRVQALRLHPVAIESCRVRLARPSERAWLEARMQAYCEAFGTAVVFHEGVGMLKIV